MEVLETRSLTAAKVPDRCCVPFCQGKAEIRFPTDPVLYSVWCSALKRDSKGIKNETELKICTKHFKPDSIIQRRYSKGLFYKAKPGVIPSLSCIKDGDTKETTSEAMELELVIAEQITAQCKSKWTTFSQITLHSDI